MPAHLIRPATTADIPTISAIYGDSVVNATASFEVEAPGEAEMERRRLAILEGGYPYIVAEDGGQVLGFAYAAAYHDRAGYRFAVEDSIYLAGDARGKGIGGALLRTLIEECEKRGFRQMIAIIGDSAHAASIRLHKAAGFDLVGTLANVGYKHGRWLDSVLMQRQLGDGAQTPPGGQIRR
jgi:L-amino acid N-acyltransferase YncA